MSAPAKLAGLSLLVLVAACAGVARADDCQRLVQPHGPVTYGRGTTQAVFAAPTTQGQWFLSVSRDGPLVGRVELNGRLVVRPVDLAGPSNRFIRVPVSVQALNTLKVVAQGQQARLTVTVVGAVPAAALPPGVGRRAGPVTLHEQVLPARAQPVRVQIPAPTTDGLFDLHLRQGNPRVLAGWVLWNDEPVLGILPIFAGQTTADGPVRVLASNRLDALVLGQPGSSVTLTLDGLVVDEVLPVAAWTSPLAGATVAPADLLRVTFSDALTGIGSVRLELDGVDVTALFDVLGAEASAPLSRLPAALTGPGDHTLRAVVRDRACGETVVTRSFVVGGGGPVDTVPPVIAQPADLVVEQQGPGGSVVSFPTPAATDAVDPAPVVVCAPASDSLFPAGVTVVTCTATDAAGNASQVTFRVTVLDRTAPVLAQPADLVVEQQGATGSVVTFPTPGATDAVSIPVVVCAPVSGSLFPAGQTVVTCTATDAAGNASQVTFRVTVLDRTAPVVTVPGDLVVQASSSVGAVVTFSITAADAVDPAPVVSSSHASGDTFPVGVTTVTATARDADGNVSAPVTFTITVQPGVVVDAVARLELTVGPGRRAAPDEGALLDLALPGASQVAPIDGRGHDPASPDEGAAGARFQRRLLAADYADGVSAPAGAGRTSARRVSNAVHAQVGSIPGQRATDLLGAWGQFVDHDLSHTRAASPVESLPIPVPAGDPLGDQYGTTSLPFSRSGFDPASSPREQRNLVTAWLDGSAIYGSDPARAAALRANDGTGRLLTSAGDLLPFNTLGLDNEPTAHAPTFFLAGDARANQNTSVLALHTVFVREHNRLAGLLAARHPGATDEELYQAARRIVVAELQAITYEEFLPLLLGPDALAPYTGHHAELEVGVENGFAAAGFRVGHTLISPTVQRKDAQGASLPGGPLALVDASFAPQRLAELDALLRGAATQPAQALDPYVVDEVRTYLFSRPGQPGGLDLVALDLQRGRDHGLPAYNEARRQLGLAPRASFAEVSSDPVVRTRLASAYGTVEQVDLLAGALCEEPVPGALVGELLFTLIKRQFELLRDGDALFYENALAGPALAAARATRLADVIRRNTGIGAELQDDVFEVPQLRPYTENDLTVRALRASGAEAADFTGFVQVSVSDGRPPLDGLVLELTQGRATAPGLAFFQTLGRLTITARTLPLAPGDPDVSGATTVDVELGAPTLAPGVPATVAAGAELVLQGLSFPGQQLELLVDGQLVATEVAGPTGAFTASLRLPPGTHQVVVRAVDPATGEVVSAAPIVVVQEAPPAAGLEAAPASLTLAVGQARALAISLRFADLTARDVTGEASYVSADPAVAAVSATGVVSGVGLGSTTITASHGGRSVAVPVSVGAPILVESSPAHDERGVAPSRETVLRFSAPLAAASVTPAAIQAEFGGQPLAGTLHLSSDRRTVTLFYAAALPTSARVRVTVSGDLLRDDLGTAIDVDKDGVAGGVLRIDFDTMSVTVVPGTVAYGRVFSSRLANEAGTTEPTYPGVPATVTSTSVSVPLGGAKISVVGAEDTLFTFTDELGSFRLEPAPAGTFFVHVEVLDPARRLRYPDIGKAWTTIAGEETRVGDIFLPIIDEDVLQPVSESVATSVTFGPGVLDQFPELAGTRLTIPPGSLYSVDGGGEEKKVGIAPVAPDRLPAPLPAGLSFSIVFTIQTQGGENFDVPAPARFPNVEGLPPGTKTALWSFNHDTGEWEVIGPMTVTQDGLFVETDPGVGILAPGWHGTLSGALLLGAGSFVPPGETPEFPRQDVPQEPRCTCLNGRVVCKAPEGPGENKSVMLHSGEERLSRTDVVIPGRGDLSFVLARTYRSRLTYDGPVGHGWDFSLGERLKVETNGDVLRDEGGGHVDTWRRVGESVYAPPAGFFETLTRRPDGVYVLREPSGLQRQYLPSGLPLAHVDRFGNVMSFEHDENGDLDVVVDPYGREIDFTFTRFADGRTRLTKVRDFTGREWLYAYDDQGNLIAVRHPIVVGTSTGNDFPSGATERYGYSTQLADPKLKHNLVSVTSPEEAALGGPPTLTIVYGTDPANALTYDKVVVRTEGGTNASGIPAGGPMTIAYELINQGISPGDKTIPRKRATIVDAVGNVRTSYVNEDDQHILDRHYTRGLRAGEPQFFETRNFFNADNQLLRAIHPSGDEERYVYGSGSRAAAETVVERRLVAGPRGSDGLGAPAEDLVWTYTYEPLYQQLLTVTDPRGNSSTYAPPLGTNAPGRYTTTYTYDYQEGTGPVPQAVALGIDLSGVPRGLGDVNGDGRTDQVFGNPIHVAAPGVTLEAGSHQAALLGTTTQTVVSDTWWNHRGQVVRTIDAEGNVVTIDHFSERDPDGDGQVTNSMWRALSNDATGFVRAVTVDAATSPRRTFTGPPLSLTTTFRYDPRGNVVAVTNPRGVTSEVELNAWDQVVVATRGADVALAVAQGQLAPGEAALRYRSRSFYDLNGRVVRSEVENRDGTTEGVGPWIESTVVYDLLGSPLEVTAEVDATTRLTTRMRYDGNRNLVETIAPEGNRVTATFDERNLPFTITRGSGTPQAATVQLDYDANGNLVRTLDAEDTDGDGEREASTLLLDGFDRVIETSDALGNKALTAYDVASQVVRSQVLGHAPGVPGSALVPYADARLHHDELGRVFRADAQLFVTPGFTTARPVVLHDQDGDGLVTTRIERDRLSRTTHVIEDDGQVTQAVFDGASRLIESRDALGNRLLRGYDPNGNPTRSTSVEVATNGIVPAETFVTRYVFDQLDRLVRVTDNAGHTSRVSYDSRNLTVAQSDPEGPLTADPLGLYPGQINGPGNTCRYVHDGLGRMIRQVCDLRVGGTGAGALDTSNPRNPDGQVALGYVFDGNSRLVGIVDDNGNRTSFGYDALDRKTSHTFADGKKYEFTYDLDSNVKTVTDPNGSVITKTYDALNRLVELDVARGAGVVGTTRETYSYDGVSRLVRSTDDNGAVAATQVWEGAYDSLGRMLEERQNGRAVSSRYSGDGKRTQVTYAGGRTISRGFDALDRITQLSDVGGPLATSDWIGPGLRELRRLNRNGTQLTFLNDAGNQDLGFDAVQRITRLRVLGAGGPGAPIVDREYGYNRASQRTFEKRNDDHGLTDRYTYDSSYRIVASSFDQDGLPGAVARDLSQVGYRYDGVGNRRDVSKTTTSVGVLAESYGVNALNQYTSVAGVSRDHDDNGNLTDDGSKLFTFDYKNRLVGALRKSDSTPIALNGYLADGRRVRKQVWNPDGGALVRDVRFVLDGAQEVEEQDWSSGVTTTTYVWSPVYVDELVEFTNASGSHFAHQDARCDVVAVTNAAGAVVERRRFDDFGRVEVRDAGGAVVAASPSGLEYGFQGRRLDPETGLVFFRARYYSPETGRFVQRDPVWDAGNVGGQYTFCGNGPGSGRDPGGTQGGGEGEFRAAERAFLQDLSPAQQAEYHAAKAGRASALKGVENAAATQYQATTPEAKAAAAIKLKNAADNMQLQQNAFNQKMSHLLAEHPDGAFHAQKLGQTGRAVLGELPDPAQSPRVNPPGTQTPQNQPRPTATPPRPPQDPKVRPAKFPPKPPPSTPPNGGVDLGARLSMYLVPILGLLHELIDRNVPHENPDDDPCLDPMCPSRDGPYGHRKGWCDPESEKPPERRNRA